MAERIFSNDPVIGLGLSIEAEAPSLLAPPTSPRSNLSHQILDIFLDHALNKFNDSEERAAAGTEKFLSIIDRYVVAGQQVEACLPAFPFKSANQVYKVLGKLPDKAEELALNTLNSICLRVKQIYKPGAKITVVSDGITYNDLLSISDRETWAYGEALRKMAAKQGFKHLAFSRMKDLLDFPMPDKLREITYVANCSQFRRLLLNKYGNDDLDMDKQIANDTDTKLTYLGYRKFLESDLRHIFPLSKELSSNGYKRDIKYLAKQMLYRGYAFARAVKRAYPDHLRLSIHESVGEHKVSISLLNTKTGYTTPWHCSVALLANGEWISAPKAEFEKDDRLELVYEDGRPSHFAEKTSNPGLPTISESSAPYLQPKKRFNGIESGYSSPCIPSPQSGCSTPFQLSETTSSVSVSTPASVDDDSPRGSSTQSGSSSTAGGFGQRLIPHILDSLAMTQPNRTLFSLTEITTRSLKFREISAKDFIRAIDKTAWWLRDQVGLSAAIRPVGYIGPHDLRHVLLTHACVKVGYAALYLSPKNSTAGALAVLEATQCDIWVKAGEVPTVPLVKDILQARSMKLLELPLLDELLDTGTTEPYPYTKTFEEAIDDPFCYLHTSGSTGIPKPIPWSHGLIGTMDAVRLLPPVEGDGGLLPWTTDWNSGDRIYSSFPMCHGAGIIMNILLPALYDLHCILGPADVVPNINLMETLAIHANIDIWSMVPSLVDELGETPDVLDKFISSKFICASGGPVSPISSGKVNDVIRVLNLTGTTEGLFIGNLLVPREDWFWFSFHPYSGFEFKQIDPETYEHWVHRKEHASLFQGIFHTFPDEDSINFKDLYMRHPTKPNLWAFKGRNDDLIVLSNGYKILPLETEAFISTHPEIQGCLVYGSNRPQAGLLIELIDPSKKSDELFEDIWAVVEKANSMSRHTNQLLRDFITFTEPDKPFVRTDKGTIKRHATMKLYENFIDRFYSSRNDETDFTVDTTSRASIVDSVRKILEFSSPGIQRASFDDDLFLFGLDSLGVFAVVKALRAAIRGLDQLAPRHLYANPTLHKFSTVLATLISQTKETDQNAQSPSSSKLQQMIERHKAHQSFRLNPFDYVNPNHYMGLVFYIPLNDGVTFEAAFENLQQGLDHTIDLIPALGGKIIECSTDEIGSFKGELCVAIPPISAPKRDILVFKDLSKDLPTFESLREGGFVPSAFKDEMVLRQDTFPQLPADILVAQANFVEGGCILAIDLNHCCLDGVGAILALKVWGEKCRFLQGDATATCDWYDVESFNHSLPGILHDLEGYAKPVQEIDPDIWGFLPFVPTSKKEDAGLLKNNTSKRPLGKPPTYTLHSVWPLPPADRKLDTTLFLIPPEKVQRLKRDVMVDPETKGIITSVSDIVQAFFWRAAVKARYEVATKLQDKQFEATDMSILELPTDGRPFFSSSLPSTYMGSMLILNRTEIPVQKLSSSDTTIGQVAFLLRESAARITPSVVHDAFTVLQTLPDYSRFSTANMGIAHMHTMISNLIMFQTTEINFGTALFGNGGSPLTMRPQLERASGRFRFLVIFPMKEDGGVELVFGTFPEEREMLMEDSEFVKYAELVDVDICSS